MGTSRIPVAVFESATLRLPPELDSVKCSTRSCANSSIRHPVHAPKAIRSAKVYLVKHSGWPQGPLVLQCLRYTRGLDAPTRSKGYSPREVVKMGGKSSPRKNHNYLILNGF